MSIRKKRYHKIVAVILALFVLGLGLTPAFANCDGISGCCNLSEMNGASHSPMKMKISEKRHCACGPKATCDDISRGMDLSFPNDIMCNGSRPGNISQSFHAIHASYPNPAIGAFEGQPEASLTVARARSGPLYLQNVTFRF